MSRIKKPFCLDAYALTYNQFFAISYALRSIGVEGAGAWKYTDSGHFLIDSSGRQFPRGSGPTPEVVSFSTALHRIAEASTPTRAEREGFVEGDLAVSLLEAPPLQVGNILRMVEDLKDDMPRWTVVDGPKGLLGDTIRFSLADVRKLTNIEVIK